VLKVRLLGHISDASHWSSWNALLLFLLDALFFFFDLRVDLGVGNLEDGRREDERPLALDAEVLRLGLFAASSSE
jgi:hypothetical protein